MGTTSSLKEIVAGMEGNNCQGAKCLWEESFISVGGDSRLKVKAGSGEIFTRRR